MFVWWASVIEERSEACTRLLETGSWPWTPLGGASANLDSRDLREASLDWKVSWDMAVLGLY